MEKEAVAQLAAMFGYEQHLGHLTASGTIANLEALWVARELHPDAAIVSGANAHYTHARVSAVLGAKHETVPAGRARADRPRRARGAADARRRRHGRGDAGHDRASARSTTSTRSPTCAPSTARGCTSTPPTAASSACSPTAREPGVAAAPFAAIARADSIVVDPHKHGLQPYGCGCVAVRRSRRSGACTPTTRPTRTSPPTQLHLGEISLECSRAGAAAAALWTTLRALPLTRDGLGPPRRRGARRGARARGAARRRRAHRASSWSPSSTSSASPAGASAADASAAAERAFDTLAEDGWHVAKLRVDTGWLRGRHPEIERRRADDHGAALLPAQAGARGHRARARRPRWRSI